MVTRAEAAALLLLAAAPRRSTSPMSMTAMTAMWEGRLAPLADGVLGAVSSVEAGAASCVGGRFGCSTCMCKVVNQSASVIGDRMEYLIPYADSAALAGVTTVSAGNDAGALRQMCEYDMLKPMFKKNLADDPRTRWQYFGSAGGIMATYPAPEMPPFCGFDPRFRPWYSSAVAGPKDVVILIDVSARMTDYSKELPKAVAFILETLSSIDFVQIVAFNSTACGGGATFGRATEGFKAHLRLYASILSLGGERSTLTGFAKAFDVFYRSGSTRVTRNHDGSDGPHDAWYNQTGGCTRSIFFLTAPGSQGSLHPTLVSAIPQWQDKLMDHCTGGNRVSIFTWVLGGGDFTEAKQLSCMTGGAYYALDTTDDTSMRNSIAHYYQLFVAGPQAEGGMRWSELYEDGFGLGWVSSVTKPIFKNGNLLGVIALDVLAREFPGWTGSSGKSRHHLENYLRVLSASCPKMTWSESLLRQHLAAVHGIDEGMVCAGITADVMRSAPADRIPCRCQSDRCMESVTDHDEIPNRHDCRTCEDCERGEGSGYSYDCESIRQWAKTSCGSCRNHHECWTPSDTRVRNCGYNSNYPAFRMCRPQPDEHLCYVSGAMVDGRGSGDHECQYGAVMKGLDCLMHPNVRCDRHIPNNCIACQSSGASVISLTFTGQIPRERVIGVNSNWPGLPGLVDCAMVCRSTAAGLPMSLVAVAVAVAAACLLSPAAGM